MGAKENNVMKRSAWSPWIGKKFAQVLYLEGKQKHRGKLFWGYQKVFKIVCHFFHKDNIATIHKSRIVFGFYV